MRLAKQDWRDAITQFVRVIKSGTAICDTSDNSAIHLLCLFYAMTSAYNLRMSLAEFINDSLSLSINYATVDPKHAQLTVLPKLRVVDSAALNLIRAIESNDHANALRALREMDVFSLCPVPNEQLLSLERLSGRVMGRPLLVFLVELSLFATELGDLGRAGEYAKEARRLAPIAWELYNICVVEGLVALDAGQVPDAVRLLHESIRACQADAHASLRCGARAPNFLLVEKLLERGERLEAIEHLIDCKRIWLIPQLRFDEWISQIENGESPELQSFEVVKAMSRPWYSLEAQCLQVDSLGGDVEVVVTDSNVKSPDEVAAERDQLVEDYMRYLDSVVIDKIRYLDDI